MFPDGWRLSLPTDQIVLAEEVGGRVRVGFGGMEYAGFENGRLAFNRVREVLPEEQLSPARSHRMLLDQSRVAAVIVDGVRLRFDELGVLLGRLVLVQELEGE